jgi:polysaccharide pyruvyl transferase WcaK-like protein
MIIEIRKAGFINKGAQLMLYAILEQMRRAYPDATFTMATSTHSGSTPFRKVVDLGLYPKVWWYRRGIQWGRLANLTPKRFREMYGLILDRDVDVVLDASGFSYSDQWGYRSTCELAQSSTYWRKNQTKVILLPQAFGPYSSPRIRRAIRKAIDNVDLVMPREETSYRHLIDVTGERSNIRICPDFTNLIQGIVPDYFDGDQHRICIVPNYRMIDKTDAEKSGRYLPFLVSCVKKLRSFGEKPFILVHEGVKDDWLAEQIAGGIGGVPILRENDPLKIKGILGASYATIGSRFHGLVSALSQGTPSLATGWSHKYQELFADYGCHDDIISVEDSDEVVTEKIARLVDEKTNKETSQSLHERSTHLKSLVEAMWQDVFALIDSSVS